MSDEHRHGGRPDSPCVHCGLCLDTCPTYRLTGLEAESPRGRLYLMDAVLDGVAPLDHDVIAHLDSCLGCLACESACPSGVRYGSRIEEFRPRIAKEDPRLVRRALGWLARAGRHTKTLASIRRVATTLDLLGLEAIRRRIDGLGLVPRREKGDRMPLVPSPQAPRLRVALLVGCVADQLRPSITRAAVNVLRRNGVEAVVLPTDSCCGALDLHSGDSAAAIRSATAMCIAIASNQVDFVITTAAGCGALLRRYDDLLPDRGASCDTAAWITQHSRDICELLVEVGLRAPRIDSVSEQAIAYHDACHLLHGCGVHQAPREVLTAAGVHWFDLGENAVCCGSAGVYNLLHPRTALDLARRKTELVLGKGVTGVAVGNIGCIMQFERALARAGRRDIAVRHPVELLEEAYRKETS
jgi:glycolate oxidase iron-sulfur subunit